MRARYEELEIRDCVAPEKAVTGSDIVVAATNSKVPVCKGDWIEKGLHLTGVLPNEFDLDCYKKADSIVIFNRLHGRDYTLRRGPKRNHSIFHSTRICSKTPPRSPIWFQKRFPAAEAGTRLRFSPTAAMAGDTTAVPDTAFNSLRWPS